MFLKSTTASSPIPPTTTTKNNNNNNNNNNFHKQHSHYPFHHLGQPKSGPSHSMHIRGVCPQKRLASGRQKATFRCRQTRKHSRPSDTLSMSLAASLLLLLLVHYQLPNAQSLLQQDTLQQPTFVRNMDLLTVRENTPVGEIVYTLEAQLDPSDAMASLANDQVRLLYALEGTQLFSVDKISGVVRVAQPIDRELIGDSITLQVMASAALNVNTASARPLQVGPTSQLTVTVLILDENDNAPRVERVRVAGRELDTAALTRHSSGTRTSPNSPAYLARASMIETSPIGSPVIELIEASDVDKSSLSPMRAICLDCEPLFELRSTLDSALNDRLNSSLILVSPLVHVPRNNIKSVTIVLTDGKHNSSLQLELTIDDVQNKPPQFVGSSSCVVLESVPIDRPIMNVHAIDGDAIAPEDNLGSPLVRNTLAGRQIIYDIVAQPTSSVSMSQRDSFKLHPLNGQLQVANKLDRESHLATGGVLTVRVRARELVLGAEAALARLQDELYETMLDKLAPFVDSAPDASAELELTVILVDVNDNEPHWLNESEITALSSNTNINSQQPSTLGGPAPQSWFAQLPVGDRETGRVFQVQVRENSLAGSPLTLRNEMFVYDLDNGANASFNLTLIDPSGLFEVEPKQARGFALVTLKLLQNATIARSKNGPVRMLDFENHNERQFILQLIATETLTAERHTSKAQVQVNVIDVNDNPPEFKESLYQASVREDATPGKSILLVHATDRDEVSRSLTYSLQGRTANLFDINKRTGMVTVARCNRAPCIDFETQRAHHLMVQVSDGEFTARVPLVITVEDASDHAPVFRLASVDAALEEGSERLEPAIKLEATDRDPSSVISYTIVAGNSDGLFTINNVTGELQLTRPVRLNSQDRDLDSDHDLSVSSIEGSQQPPQQQQQPNKILTLIVQANDGVHSANATVRVHVLDANDNAPKFLRPLYEAEIDESALAGQLVTSVRAVDSDRGNNARVSYRIERGSYNQFDIDTETGTISVAKTTRPFDASRRSNYTLEILAYDHGLVPKSSSTQVHVRILGVRTRAPEFEPVIQRAQVGEATLNNTIVHRMTVKSLGISNDPMVSLVFEPGPIEALDRHGRQVRGLEASERLESMFSVSSSTGDVLVNSALDHQLASHVNLTVYVSARMPTLVAGSEPAAGIDSEPPQQGVLLTSTRSAGYLLISVVDENSHPPVFGPPWSAAQPELWFQMLEELPAGSVLAQLVASDAESKISHFKIDPPSEYFELRTTGSLGVIVTKKPIDYDALMARTLLRPGQLPAAGTNGSSPAGNNNVLQFNVFAYDSGVPQLHAKAIVSVEIMPINDCDCKFEQQVYEARVRENTIPDTLVVQVRANDADFGELHNSIRYELVGDYSEYFSIEPRNGLITVSQTGSAQLDRERLSRSTISLTVVARDDGNARDAYARTCSASVRVHVDDVNDNPALFTHKLYDITAYDTDAIDVPLVKLIVRDDDQHANMATTSGSNQQRQPANTYRILSGNVNDSFNISSTGQLYATKPLNESLATTNGTAQLRIQVRQQSSNYQAGGNSLTSFTDECVVRITVLKMNRHAPEWRFESRAKSGAVSVLESARVGTLVTQLRCVDRDLVGSGSMGSLNLSPSGINEPRSRWPRADPLLSTPSTATVAGHSIRYSIRDASGAVVSETREFRLDPISGNLTTRIELDREHQDFYQLVVACEDNGRPKSLESVTPLYITVLDVDDNLPEFIVSSAATSMSSTVGTQRDERNAQREDSTPTIMFALEEHQIKGLPVGELRAIDRDLAASAPSICYCVLEGNEFQEFALDSRTGILYTNTSLDRERQSSYELLIKAINDGQTCEQHAFSHNAMASNSSSLRVPARVQPSSKQHALVRIDVLDINDNGPIFRRHSYSAAVHHRSLMNSLVTQVAAFDPDSGANASMSYKISEILLYKTYSASGSGSSVGSSSKSRFDHISSDSNSIYNTLAKPIKLVQFPFKIDQQGNIYTQQLLTQYQLMSMFALQIEATELAEPWRMARTKLEIYVYETSHQLKMRINLHPRLVEQHRSEIETLLSNATGYTAIINRARSYYGHSDAATAAASAAATGGANSHLGRIQKDSASPPSAQIHLPTATSANSGVNNGEDSEEPSSSNIHLIFVDQFRIVNPSAAMERFDMSSAQLLVPQMIAQQQLAPLNSKPRSSSELELPALIDKIALASVQSAEYHASAAAAGIIGLGGSVDWLESPSVLYVTLTVALAVAGFVVFLFGCCCTSRIKDHIIKAAMDKLVKQQQLQAKINERVLAATNGHTTHPDPTDQIDYAISQAGSCGYMSSFDATKSCITNNNDNMNILARAIDSAGYGMQEVGQYTTMNGHINMGAHYYDPSDIDEPGPQMANGRVNGNAIASESCNLSITSSLQHEQNILNNHDNPDDDQDLKKNNGAKTNGLSTHTTGAGAQQRQRQQVPYNTNK